MLRMRDLPAKGGSGEKRQHHDTTVELIDVPGTIVFGRHNSVPPKDPRDDRRQFVWDIFVDASNSRLVDACFAEGVDPSGPERAHAFRPHVAAVCKAIHDTPDTGGIQATTYRIPVPPGLFRVRPRAHLHLTRPPRVAFGPHIGCILTVWWQHPQKPASQKHAEPGRKPHS